MRWLLGRGERTCHVCDAALERGAPWCGACGARADQPQAVADRRAAVAVPAGSDVDASGTEGSGDGRDDADGGGQVLRRRRTLGALVVIGLAALVVASQVRAPVPEPRLGYLGASTGMSATGPPPSGLRLAWAEESTGRGDIWFAQSVPQDVAVRDGRARVGNLVLDLADGHLVRVVPDSWGVRGAEHTIVDGRDLVVLDALTGAIRNRAPLPEDWADGPVWATHRARGATLLRSDLDSALVADDGTVVAELDGVFVDYVDRAVQDPAAFPLRGVGSGSWGDGDELNTSLRLVAAATGATVVDLPGGRLRLVDVMGDRAMIASTDALGVDPFGGTPNAGDVNWTVQLLDAGTGQQLQDLTVVSREGPRLLGTFADGTVVIGTRLADEHALLAVRPDGAVSSLAQVRRLRDAIETGMYARSSVLNAAVVTGDVLAVLDGDGGLIALDRTGSRLWELAAPGVAGLRGGDGHLALVPDGEDRGRVRVVRASDGEVVGSVQPPEDAWAVAETVGFPFATLDGHVGISHAGGPGAAHQLEDPLVLTRWLDLRTGERSTFQDVFAPYTGEEEAGTNWALHGVVTDDLGRLQPVVSRTDPEPAIGRTQPQQTVELLEPGEGLRTYDLPLPEVHADYVSGFMVVGATAEQLAVWHEGGGPEPSSARVGTVVLDRTTGESTTFEGVLGLVLLDGLLLGQEIDNSYTVTSLVALDPATGERLWSSDADEPYAWSDRLRVDDELIIDTGRTRITARSTRDGSRRWTHSSDTELSGEVVLGPRHVVVTATDGEVVALDRADGAVAWRAELGTPVASLTGAGDHVLAGTHDGLVVHLDRRGREVQRIAVGAGAVHAVAALGDTVVAIVDGRVVGLRTDGTGITRGDEVELP